MQAAKTDVQAISAATQKMDNQVTSLALDNTELKRKVQDMIQDNRKYTSLFLHRFPSSNIFFYSRFTI